MKTKNIVLAALTSAATIASINVMAAGNIQVEESVQLTVKPSAVWALVGDYNGLYRWHPAVTTSERNDKTRLLTLGNGAQITETLLDLDNAQHSYRYAIEQSPLPVADYESTIQVSSDGKGGSTVTWSSSFNAAGAPDKEAADVIRGVYQAGLANLEKLYN